MEKEKVNRMLNRRFDLPIAGRAEWKDGLRWQDYHEIIGDCIMPQIEVLSVFVATCIESGEGDDDEKEWAQARLWEAVGPIYDILKNLKDSFHNIFDMVVYMEAKAKAEQEG